MKDDPVTLVSSYTGPNGQVQLPSDKDVSQRCLKVLHPDLSVLGVTLDNTSWESKILTCSRNATSCISFFKLFSNLIDIFFF